jgi:hypothetical protein
MDRRKFYEDQKVLRLEAGARLYNDARRMCKEAAQRHLLNEYVDDLRQCRKINKKQWEVGKTLAGEWHGTAEDLLTAIKELA